MNTKSLLFTLITGLSIFSFQLTQSYVESIYTYRSADGNLVNLLGTRHMDYMDGAHSEQQLAQIANIAKAENATVFAEDLWSYNGSDKRIKDYVAKIKTLRFPFPGKKIMFKGSSQGFQPCLVTTDCTQGLIDVCTRLGIPTRNVECRYHKDASNIGFPISGQEVWTNLRDIMNQILNYEDGDTLTEAYAYMISTALHKNYDLIQKIYNATTPSLQPFISSDNEALSLLGSVNEFLSEPYQFAPTKCKKAK